MAGDVSKVKIGAAWVTWGNTSLGYTKGGILFEVETQVQPITMTQAGVIPLVEVLMGTMVRVTCPLAETDYVKLSALIPGNTSGGISYSVGGSAMGYGEKLVISPMVGYGGTITLENAIPTGNTRATFTYDGERIWPVQFKGYMNSSGKIVTWVDSS